MIKLTSAVVAIASAATWLAPAQAQVREVTGEAGAVSDETRGSLQSGPVKSLLIGNTVFVSEHILTDASGRTQLLFLDGMRAFIAPNSEVILNNYRFDRRSLAVELVATVVEGEFRLTAPALGFDQGGATASAQTDSGGAFAALSPTPKGSLSPSTSPAAASERSGNSVAYAGTSTTSSSSSSLDRQPPPAPPPPAPPPPAPAPAPPSNVPFIGGVGLRALSLHILGGQGGEIIVVLATSGGPQDVKISRDRDGLVTVLSLAPTSITVSTRLASAQMSRPGFAIQISPAGVMTGPMRATPAMFDRIAASAAKPASRSAAAARSGPVEAIGAGNSARSIGQLLPEPAGASLREVDPRRLDRLAGNTPGQIGTFRQQTYIAGVVEAGLASTLLNVLPATVTVSAPAGARTVQFSRAANGALISSPAGASLAELNALGRPAIITIVTPAGRQTLTLPR